MTLAPVALKIKVIGQVLTDGRNRMQLSSHYQQRASAARCTASWHNGSSEV